MTRMHDPGERSLSVAVVGAGAAGLGMAAKLKSAGFDNIVIYERASEVGGVWRDNSYPGLHCDIPAHAYSFSFAPNPQWSGLFAQGPEIHAYLQRLVDQYRLDRHLHTGEEVETARYQDGTWQVTTSKGVRATYDILLCATGVLVNPQLPALPGLDDFTGAAVHSARWDRSLRTAGKRIAVIGNGSTGVQLTCALAPEASRFLLFQRTAQWVFPIFNIPYSALTRAVYRRAAWPRRLAYRWWRTVVAGLFGAAVVRPGWRRSTLSTVCRIYLNLVRDPGLRDRLTPRHDPMCKRLVFGRGFYRAMQLPHVELVTEPIERISATGVVTRDGREHAVDIIVFATGFRARDYTRPMTLTGRNGITLDQVWADGPHAYHTVALPGFPNLFMLVGPNSPFSHESVLSVAETQADYILKWLELFRSGDVAEAEPTVEATARFNEAVRAAMPETIFASGCDSWYLGPDGVPMVWPWTARAHRQLLSRVRLEDFHVRRGAAAPEPRPTSLR
jgi:cation diffusion facilitator CzcD-associated flavoprotein CzcO